MSIFLAEETNDFFSASLNYVWGIVRRKSLHYDIEDHLVSFAACHEWYTIHNLCWTRACHDHQPRRWSGMVWEYFFTHWLQGFAIFSLALLFIIGPLSQNWKVWQPLCCDLKWSSVCSTIKTRNFARTQYISLLPNLTEFSSKWDTSSWISVAAPCQ